MEVKVGISESQRELVVSSIQTPEEVEKIVTAALSGNGEGVLSLSDEKGRKYLIQTSKISYVEIGPSQGGRVGFAPS